MLVLEKLIWFKDFTISLSDYSILVISLSDYLVLYKSELEYFLGVESPLELVLKYLLRDITISKIIPLFGQCL